MPFRVLLSYAHDDANIAAWLRSRARAYQTPRSLVGARGALGPVPARFKLTPARQFDQNDLDELQALVVICSPSAAADADVNRDIDAFITQGRTRRIVPVIAANAPDTQDVERDYFPPAISGRGLFTVDLRERRVGDALSGDGREGGWLKLVAELLGVDVARLAEHEGRRSHARAAVLTITAAACAFAAMAAAAYGVHATQRADALEAQRQNAALNAMHALQLRREAVAAAEQQAAAQATAGRELGRAKSNLLGAVRDMGGLADAMLDEISESRTSNPESLRSLAALERIYWDLGDVSPYFEIPPNTITAMIERISSLYVQIGRTDDAKRVDSRLAQLTGRVSRNHAANPAWRAAYAAAIVTISDHRGANGDDSGKASALQQAAHIYEDVCLATPPEGQEQTTSVDAIRANACLRFASLILARAAQQRDAQQDVDTASLQRARLVLEAAVAAYPNNAAVQSRAPNMRAQIDHALEPLKPTPVATAVHD